MDRNTSASTAGDDAAQREQAAREYLDAQLMERAPASLRFERSVHEQPLEDEGPVSIFSFSIPVGPACGAAVTRAPGVDAVQTAGGGAAAASAGEAERHFVVVGQTKPNYFPGYGFDADDAYSFHVGTRFALETQIARLDDALEPPGSRVALQVILKQFAPSAQASSAVLAGVFRCDEQYFAVYRIHVDGRELYCFGGDCPPGFYELTQHPPQVALRLHLGKLIRAEAAAEARVAEQSQTG